MNGGKYADSDLLDSRYAYQYLQKMKRSKKWKKHQRKHDSCDTCRRDGGHHDGHRTYKKSHGGHHNTHKKGGGGCGCGH